MQNFEYLIIKNTEDGVAIDKCNLEELKEKTLPDEYGIFYYGEQPIFLDYLPNVDNGYLQCKRNEIVILKATIVKVIPKKIIADAEYV